VCIGHRGVYWFEVTTLGRIGHGSMPGYGVNAADTMTAFIHALNTELRPRIESRETAMPVVPEQARRPTLNLNALHGGQALHADHLLSSCVADRCVAVWDRRYLHEESFESVREEIVEVLDRLAASDPRFRYELRDLWSVPPIATPRKAPVVGAFGRAIAEVVGREPTVVMSPGTYDHKHVTMRAGIVDCIAYGPGRLDLAHLPDEFVDIDELVAAAKVMAVATMRLAGTE
jgi:succinyl-diaminopimelate desuccinylase